MSEPYNIPEWAKDSCFKLIVWYKDGNMRTRYSKDRSGGGKSPINPELGFTRLQEYVEKRKEYIVNYTIYDKRTDPDRIVRKYVNGEMQINEPI